MRCNWDGTQTSPTLTSRNASGAQRMPDKENFNCVIEGDDMETVVRRITPLEAERLQGFPDNWTLIGEPKENKKGEIEYWYTDENGKEKKVSDSARYKALGNSIAVGFANNESGFWMWLMKRISAEYERKATLGSLFDGISGFPLAWSRFNGSDSARWGSEVESFCIAVAKAHFGDEDAGIEGDIREYL